MPSKSQKILIVDDEREIAESVKFCMESQGYHCSVSHDGLDALKKVRREMPDLILLDVMLPKQNGYQVCRFIKFDRRYHHIPILMLSSNAQETDRFTAKKAGANEYMTKPFEMKKLVSKVKRYLEKQ